MIQAGSGSLAASRYRRVCHAVLMDEDLWAAYDRMGLSFQEHAADGAFNAHYDRPAVLAALGPVTGLRVLDAACGPGLYLRELLEREQRSAPSTRARSWWPWPGS